MIIIFLDVSLILDVLIETFQVYYGSLFIFEPRFILAPVLLTTLWFLIPSFFHLVSYICNIDM